MGMLLRIVKHEWRNLIADRTLWWVTLILVMAIGYGVHNGTSWVNQSSTELKLC
jgi:ABC-2 type transport system permease protein